MTSHLAWANTDLNKLPFLCDALLTCFSPLYYLPPNSKAKWVGKMQEDFFRELEIKFLAQDPGFRRE
jgi:hypothetical protein